MSKAGIHEAAGGLVSSNPEVLGGKPVFRGTRVPTATLFEYLADGLSLDYFLESFPSVSREQAVGVLRYVTLDLGTIWEQRVPKTGQKQQKCETARQSESTG